MSASPDDARVVGLDHAGLCCADLDAALAFFVGVLGIAVRERGEIDDDASAAAVGRPGLRARFADLDLGAGRTLELLELLRKPDAGQVANDPLIPGGTHVALRVAGIEQFVRRAHAAGYVTRSDAPIELRTPGFWHGARIVYLDGPDGLTVELIER